MMRNLGFLIFFLFLISCNQNIEKEYYKSGKIKRYFPLDKKGLYDGKCIQYYENGNICRETTINHGLFNGIVKKYYINGSLEFSMEYNNDKKDGYTCRFDTVYQLVSLEYYSKDSLVSMVEFEKGEIFKCFQSMNLEIDKNEYLKGDSICVKTSICFSFYNNPLTMILYISKFKDKYNASLLEEYKVDKYISPKEIVFKSKIFQDTGQYIVCIKYINNDNIIIADGYQLFEIKSPH